MTRHPILPHPYLNQKRTQARNTMNSSVTCLEVPPRQPVIAPVNMPDFTKLPQPPEDVLANASAGINPWLEL
jgi:hypothetical protein